MINQQKIKLILPIITLIVFISLLFLNNGYIYTLLLSAIFYIFSIAFIDKKLGLFLLILIRPCLGLFINEPIISLGKFSPNTVSLFGGLTLIFTSYIILKNFKDSQKLPLLGFWTFFLIITIITIPFSLNPSGSVKEIIRLFSIFFIFWASFLTIKTNKDLSSLIKVIVFSGLIPSIVAFYQFFFDISLKAPGEDVVGRVFGTFSHPNLLAFYLIVPLAMCCLIFLVSNKKKISIAMYGLMSIFLALSLGLTYTRGAWIGFFIIVALLGIIKYRWFLVIALLTIGVVFFSSSQIQNRVLSLSNPDPYGSIQYRINLWQDTIGHFWNKPILGYGSDSSQLLIGQGKYHAGSNEPHNDYIKIILENGIVGLLAYFGIIIALFTKLFNLYKKEKRARLKTTILVALILSISVFTVSLGDNILKNTSLMWSFWALLGGLLAILQIKKISKK